MELSPADAVVALRSFPRRFREVLALRGGETESALHRNGPDGRSALEHVDLAGRDLAVLGDAVARALTEDRPTLHPAVADAGARAYAVDPGVDATAALDLVSSEAGALADRVEHVDAAAWSRVVTVAGAGERTAADILREAVQTTAAHLRAAEQARQEG
jgi:hypothetical protein